MNCGKAIPLFRLAAGVSQKELADLIEVTPSYLSLIEGGLRQPSLDVLERIAIQLGTKVSTIIKCAEDIEQGGEVNLTVSLRLPKHDTKTTPGE